MNHIAEIFEAIARTLATVKTDNTDGNWNKLMGCIKACSDGAALCRKEEPDNGESV